MPDVFSMKLPAKRTISIFLAVGVFITVFIFGCTSEKQYRVLSFFFDGVPNPNQSTEALINQDNCVDSTASVKKDIKPEYFLHKPYEEEKCKSCHAEGFSNALIKPMPELCYSCHEDFRSKYPILHGPVASGNCTMCHNQHMAKFEKLLDRCGQQICLNCHESNEILKNKMHEQIANRNCTECHSPHGGNNSGMLKPGSCFNCHNNFDSKFKFLHGPVASGNCTACHDSHASKSRKLLIRDSQQLCYACHDAEQILKNVAHKKIKKNNCTECHNPHGGEDRLLLQSMIKETIKINTDTGFKIKSGPNPEIDSTLNKSIRQK